MTKIYPFIMAGGIGSRLWPLSRSGYPKQFLKLTSNQSMLQEAIERCMHPQFETPTIICNEQHRFLVAEHARQSGIKTSDIILEAQGQGTAFTIALAALKIMKTDPQGLIFVLPCDQLLKDPKALHSAILTAAPHSKENLFVFGVPPENPHTGYGYIEQGTEMADGLYKVKSFKEKPDAQTAQTYLETGGYFWNSGIFLFSAALIINELETHAPQILIAAKQSLSGAVNDLDFIRLPLEPLKDCPNISIDYAVLEKSQNVALSKLHTKWSDLGSWASVWDNFDKDADNNVTRGDTLALDTHFSLLHAEGDITLAALGLEDIIIIADEDAVLVAPKSRSEEIGQIVKNLKARGSHKQDEHTKVFRPWGNYKVLKRGPGYLIKSLILNVDGAVSLQYHNHRAEHWVLISGQIKVECDGKETILMPNESAFIPLGAHHRMTNIGDTPAEIIEVQTGDKLIEDDIIRLEDKYKRV